MPAARWFHGAPWADLVRYRGSDGEQRVGQASLVTKTRSSAWVRLIVRRAEAGPPTTDCVLIKNMCERLWWSVSAGGDATRFDAVEAKEIVRSLPVEYD